MGGPEAAHGWGGRQGEALAAAAAKRCDRLPGRHALALSLTDGSWLRRAAHDPFVAASVIKLPLLVAALARAEAGALDLAERVPLVGQRFREGVPRLLHAFVAGSKGGWLTAARHDAGCVWDDAGRRLATVVVLSADHGDTRFGPDHPAILATARLARDAVELVRAPARRMATPRRGTVSVAACRALAARVG